MKRLLLALCCLPLAMSFTAPAEIYKWKDKSGKIQYSDSPPLSNIPYTTLSGKKPAQSAAPAQAPAAAPAPVQPMPAPGGKAGKTPTNVPPMPPGGPQAPSDPEATKEKIPQELKDKAAQEAANKQQDEQKKLAEAKNKEQACKDARSRLAQFEQGGRIYKVNEKGEREYYGDKEIAAELQNAKDDVAANCS
jgi:hypothetical protein